MEKLRIYLPELRLLKELLVDAEALNYLSTIIKMQEEWIKHRASTLYIDPLLIELKIRLASNEELARAFLNSMHPITYLNQLTPMRLTKSMDYWNRLLTLEQRFKKNIPSEIFPISSLSVKDLIEMKVISQEEFNIHIKALRLELKNISKHDEGVNYWDFIYRDSFSETVIRAYLTSFLVSEGYAILLVDPLEDEVRIAYMEAHRIKGVKACSIALSLSYESWSRLHEMRR